MEESVTRSIRTVSDGVTRAGLSAIHFRRAIALDIEECVAIRGKTRENAVSESRLAEFGVTAESWSAQVAADELLGFVSLSADSIVGYCFGDVKTGEIVVLALLPEYEGQGLGRALLGETMQSLRRLGHTRLFLGCNSLPHIRSFGFYRHLGWRSTGRTDKFGDEELEYFFS
jgi:GNAT superfamily N-acetyltransferase